MLQPDHFQATLWMLRLIDSDIWNQSIVGNDCDSSFKCLESISPLDKRHRCCRRTAAAEMPALIDAISQAQYRCCSVNMVVGLLKKKIATVTDSVHLEKNNELMNYKLAITLILVPPLPRPE